MNPEAIEAAARTFAGYTPEAEADDLEREVNASCRTLAKRVLEAAAPYLIREARAAELETAADDFIAKLSGGTGDGRDYNSYRAIDIMLRDRAAAIRAGAQ